MLLWAKFYKYNEDILMEMASCKYVNKEKIY